MFQQYSNSIPSLLHHYSIIINDSPLLTIIYFPLKSKENPGEYLYNVSLPEANCARPQHRRPRVRALDCEMVGVGPRGKRSVLIRVSVVSRHGKAGLGGEMGPFALYLM